MLRYEVPVDDAAHGFALTGDPVAVAPIGDDGVEFWAEDDAAARRVTRRVFTVVGTGDEIPPGALWRGTCQRSPAGLVWHLYELTP